MENMNAPDEKRAAEGEPSNFALGVTAAVLFVVASYVTATLLYAILGKQGIPLSPLLIVVPAVPVYVILLKLDQRFEKGDKRKNRILAVACFAPLAISVVLAVAVPIPVLVNNVPRGGAFGITVTACVVIVILLMMRAQWSNRRNER